MIFINYPKGSSPILEILIRSSSKFLEKYTASGAKASHVREAFLFYRVFIQYSLTSNIYYVGYTNNHLRRFHEHNTSEKSIFATKNRPWQLKAVHICNCGEKGSSAIDKFIKKQEIN